MEARFRLADKSEGRLAPNRQLPLVVEPVDARDVASLRGWICAHRGVLEEKLRLHGGILFRGFTVTTPEEFEEVATAVEPELSPGHPFDGPGVRRWWTRSVAEALDSTITRSPQLLSFHNENSFMATHPSKVMFSCLRAPHSGGETAIVDCREVYKALSPRVLGRFRGRWLLSPIRIPFSTVAANCGTEDKQEIEELCKEHGVLEVTWLDGGDLGMLSAVAAIIRHPDTMEPVWFNRAHGADAGSWAFEKAVAATYGKLPFEARQLAQVARFVYWVSRRRLLRGHWGDGGQGLRFDDESAILLRDQLRITMAYWKNAVVLAWREGDVLVLDNRLVAHARMPHAGERKILFCMSLATPVEMYSS